MPSLPVSGSLEQMPASKLSLEQTCAKQYGARSIYKRSAQVLSSQSSRKLVLAPIQCIMKKAFLLRCFMYAAYCCLSFFNIFIVTPELLSVCCLEWQMAGGRITIKIPTWL